MGKLCEPEGRLNPIRAKHFQFGPGGSNADPWLQYFNRNNWGFERACKKNNTRNPGICHLVLFLGKIRKISEFGIPDSGSGFVIVFGNFVKEIWRKSIHSRSQISKLVYNSLDENTNTHSKYCYLFQICNLNFQFLIKQENLFMIFARIFSPKFSREVAHDCFDFSFIMAIEILNRNYRIRVSIWKLTK